MSRVDLKQVIEKCAEGISYNLNKRSCEHCACNEKECAECLAETLINSYGIEKREMDLWEGFDQCV